MVNVASAIPFNLHNQVLPKPQSQSVSRSASGSREPQDYGQGYLPYSDFYNTHELPHHRRKKPYNVSRSTQVYSHAQPQSQSSVDDAGSSLSIRTASPTREQPKPTPILNVRLVGYTDTRTRGRARERGPQPSGLSGSKPTPSLEGDVDGVLTPTAAVDGSEEIVAEQARHAVRPFHINIDMQSI